MDDLIGAAELILRFLRDQEHAIGLIRDKAVKSDMFGRNRKMIQNVSEVLGFLKKAKELSEL